MKNIRVLFINKLIYDYRLSFYEKIASIPEYNVTVLHSGKSMKRPDSKFNEIIVPEYSFKGLLWQKSTLETAKSADIVIAQFDLHYMSTIALSLLPHKFKLIYWGIGFGHSRLANKVRLFLAKKDDALALYMPGNMLDFVNSGISKDKVFCAPNTIYVEKPFFHEDVSVKNHFLFLGSLKQRKKADDLLLAFKKALSRLTKKMYIDIVGDGEMMFHLKNLTKDLEIEDYVKFHGSISDNERLAPFFKRALAIVSPGQAGLTILHGFAHGVPMVTYRYAISGGEMENIVDGRNGVLYDGSVDALAEVLVKLANNPAYANNLGRNAYEYYVGNMTLDHMVNSFQNIIEFVLQRRN